MLHKYLQLFEDIKILFSPLLAYFLNFIVQERMIDILVSVVMTVSVVIYKSLVENPMLKFYPNLKF